MCKIDARNFDAGFARNTQNLFAYSITWFQTFFLLFIYAIFIEFSQLFTFNRSAELLDVVADVIGIGIGLLFYPFIKRLIMSYAKYEHY